MKKETWVLLACLGVASTVSCDDDETTSGETFSAIASERNTQIDTVCDCFDELDWPSSSACVNGQEPILPSSEDCAKSAFTAAETESRTFLECVLPLMRNFSDCLDSRLECSVTSGAVGVEACITDFNIGAQNCIQLPQAVVRDLENCNVDLINFTIRDGSGAGGGGGGGGGACSNTCPTSNDGECDDGGPNAEFNICELGTDCADCGPR